MHPFRHSLSRVVGPAYALHCCVGVAGTTTLDRECPFASDCRLRGTHKKTRTLTRQNYRHLHFTLTVILMILMITYNFDIHTYVYKHRGNT